MSIESSFLDRFKNYIGSLKIIIFSGIIYFISQAIIIFIFENVGSEYVLKLQTTLSADYFRETMEYFKKTGIMEYYIMHYYFDFLHPIWYSVFLSASLSWLFISLHILKKYNWFILIPFIAGFCDLLENTIHSILITNFDLITPLPVAVSGIVSIVKWSLAGISLIAIILLFLRLKVKRDYQ
jgi:hypothetical protein